MLNLPHTVNNILMFTLRKRVDIIIGGSEMFYCFYKLLHHHAAAVMISRAGIRMQQTVACNRRWSPPAILGPYEMIYATEKSSATIHVVHQAVELLRR